MCVAVVWEPASTPRYILPPETPQLLCQPRPRNPPPIPLHCTLTRINTDLNAPKYPKHIPKSTNRARACPNYTIAYSYYSSFPSPIKTAIGSHLIYSMNLKPGFPFSSVLDSTNCAGRTGNSHWNRCQCCCVLCSTFLSWPNAQCLSSLISFLHLNRNRPNGKNTRRHLSDQ